MKYLDAIVLSLFIPTSLLAFTPCQVTRFHDQILKLDLHPDQAPELEEAAEKQWLEAALKLDDEEEYLAPNQANRAFGKSLSASISTNKSNQPPLLWWSRAFSRLVRRKDNARR